MHGPRRIRIDISSLVVDDPALARPAEIAEAAERELARTTLDAGRVVAGGGRVTEVGVSLGAESSARAVGRAIAHGVGGELAK
jgi:hypothetical protein